MLEALEVAMIARFTPLAAAAALLALTASCTQEEPWKPLFAGGDMSGWEHVGPGEFTVEEGNLVTHGGMGLLYYGGEKLGNCVVRIVYKRGESERGNAGVFIRIPEAPKDPWYPVHHGYEVQIEDAGDEFHRTGAIYSMSRADTFPPSEDGWNTMEITLDGQRTTVAVNGTVVNDFDPTAAQIPERKRYYEPQRGPRPDEGYIGLQNHDENSVLLFKEVSVRPLRK
jgi:hypothetical protein